MKLRLTNDLAEIKRVLCHPEIYAAIGDDDSPDIEDFEPPLDGYDYYIGVVNNEIVGIMIYHYEGEDLHCHVQVLPEHREQHAKIFGGMALDIGLANNRPVYAEIPDCHRNVLKFAKLFGFEVYETEKDSYHKNGVKHDLHKLRCLHGIC